MDPLKMKPEHAKQIAGACNRPELEAMLLDERLAYFAMHEAEAFLFASNPGFYERAWYAELVRVVTGLDPSNDGWGDVDARQHAYTVRATAAQRCEAFLKTLSLWKPDEK